MMYDSPLAVLVVDADRTGADCACRMLSAKASPSESIRVLAASSIADALSIVGTESVDVALLEAPPDEVSMLDAVRRLRGAAPDLPIVVAADESRESLASQAVHAGAQDYVIKGVDDARVVQRALRHAVERASLARAHDALLYREHHARLAAEEARSEADRARTRAESIERQATFLAGATLGSSLDARATLATTTRLAVPMLGECAVGFLAEDDGTVDVVEAVHGPQPDCDRVRTMARAMCRGVDIDGLLARARRHGHLVLSDAPATVPAHHCMLVPLAARGRVLGALGLIVPAESHTYDAADLALAQAFADRAAIALDNAKLYEASCRAIRTRDHVLGIVSHDLRNPLSAIGMCTTALQNDAGLTTGERRRLVGTIRESVNWTQRLIADLLDVASIEAGKLSVVTRLTDPIVIISRALDLFELGLEGRVIRLADDVPDILPPINGDEQRILQVLANLIANALKFTPPRGRVTLGVEAMDDAVAFRVSDNGPGIAPEHLEHIFDWFWRASHERAERGTGLGLAIAKGIVDAHGGHLTVESVAGHGATFSFTIPRVARVVNPAQALTSEDAALVPA